MSRRYDDMLRLADSFEEAAGQLRAWSHLGREVLADPGVAESATLSPRTWEAAEDAVRRATGGRDGLLARSAELDADALVVRATVATYEWIDGLQEAATRTLGTIAGRAVGFLAPEIELGGAVVGAGLIETDALDRDEVADFLGELAEQHPELLDHLRGGGLLDELRMRALLTLPTLSADGDERRATAGLRALGVEDLRTDSGAAVRDVAAALAAQDEDEDGVPSSAAARAAAPRSLADVMTVLAEATARVVVQQVGPGRFVAHLPGPHRDGRLRLVTGDPTPYAAEAVATLESVVGDDAHVMLVGAGLGGSAAAQVAASPHRFTVDHLLTVGSPDAHVARVPADTQVLALEDRHDPVALLGALVTRADSHRLTVVFDGTDLEGGEGGTARTGTGGARLPAYVDGARAADASPDPRLRAAIGRMVEQGFLVG